MYKIEKEGQKSLIMLKKININLTTISLILISLAVIFTIGISDVSAAEWNVTPGSSIQTTIDNANENDTINILDNSGTGYTYNENVNINKKNITIKAKGNVTLKAQNSNSPVITVNTGGNYSTIQGFKITGATTSSGIKLTANNCLILNNTIFNNIIGISTNSSSGINEIKGNNIYNNSIGISNQEGNLSANFNRIVGNTNGLVNNGENVNAENNWWGYNSRTDVANQITGANVDYDPWIVLTVSKNYTTTNGTSIITADLTHNSNGIDTSALGNVPNGINTNFNCSAYGGVNLGTLSPTNVSTANGSASTTFTAGSKKGIVTVSATVDNQTVSNQINIGSVPDVSIGTYAYSQYTDWNYNVEVPFILYVKNNQAEDVTGLVVKTQLPDGVQYLSSNLRNGGTYSYDPQTHILTWYIDTLPGKTSLIFEYTIIAKKIGSSLINSTVYAGNVNKSATWNLNTLNSADVQVTQTATNYAPKIGDVITIRITAKNNGPGSASGVNIAYTLPSGLTLYGTNPITKSKGTYTNGIWNIGTLGLNETVTLDLTVQIGTTNTITSNAYITKVSGITTSNDWNTTNNGQTIKFNPNTGTVDVSIGTYAYSQYTDWNYNVEVPFILYVKNNQAEDVTGLVVKTQLPDGVQYLSSNLRNGGTYSYDPQTHILTWYIDTLPGKTSLIFEYTIIAKKIGSSLINSTVYAGNVNKSATWNLNTLNSADVQVTQTATNYAPKIGDVITIRITAKNNGPGSASGVNIAYTLPSGLTLYGTNPITKSKGTYTNGIWNIGTLGLNETVTLDLTVQIGTTNTITSNAYITKVSGITTSNDWNTTNNGQTIYIMDPAAHIAITNNANTTTPNYKGNVKITITATNNGPDTATNIKIKDLLPTGLQYISCNPSTGTYDPSTGIWTINNLTNGTTATLEINALIMQTGSITNNVSVIAQDQYDNQSYENVSTTLNIPSSADVKVTQTTNNNAPNYLQNIILTIIAHNNGPDTANNVQITSLLPAGLKWISDDSQGAYNSATGVWTVGALNYGVDQILHITAQVIGTGSITNAATKTSETEYDWNTTNDQENVSLNVPQSSHIAITNNANTTTPNYKGNVKITITATNNGPNTATNIKIKNLLPSGLQYVSCNPSTGTYDPTTGIWTINNLTNGTTATLDITALVTQTGSITDTANVTAQDQYDPTGYESKNIILNVPSSADVKVTQTTNNNAPNYLQNIILTIIAHNNGPDTANNVQITSLLPAGLKWISDDSQGAYNSNTGVWTVGTLTYGAADKILHITAQVIGTGPITNTATKTAENEYDWNTTNDQQNITLNVPQSSHITITNNANTTTPNYKGNVKITITATNNGPDTATNIKIKNLLPSGLQYVSCNPSTGTYDSSTGIWAINSLTNSATATLEITALVTQTGSITDTASMTAQDQYDPTGYESKNVNLNVPASADIAVTQSANTTTPYYHQNVTLTITVTNKGPDTANNINITDYLPSGLQFISATPSTGSYNGEIWTISSLNSGASATLSIVAQTLTAGSIINTGAKTGETEYDWNTSNDQQSINLNVPVPTTQADIGVTQTINDTTPNIGDLVTITIRVKNNGPNTASGIKITDLLPSGLIYSSSSTRTGTYDSNSGVWTITSINSGRTATLTIVAAVSALNSITNIATKTWENEYDPFTANDTSSVTITSVGNQATHFTNNGSPSGTVNMDDGSMLVQLPFTVTLYGQQYNSMYINTNGLVSFGAPITVYKTQTPYNIPYIAPFWDDIDLRTGGSVTYQVTANQTVITWSQVTSYNQYYDNPKSYNNFQLILTNDGRIGFVYGDMQWDNDWSGHYSIAGFCKGDGSSYNNLWTGAQSLSAIANQTFWFDSNGNRIS